MALTSQNKTPVLNKLAKAQGHLDAVYRMVDDERYCIDVLHQLKAVQGALDKITEDILKQHLESCVVKAIQDQDTERVLTELMAVFKKAPSLDWDPEALKAAPPKPSHQKSSKPSGGGGCCGS